MVQSVAVDAVDAFIFIGLFECEPGALLLAELFTLCQCRVRTTQMNEFVPGSMEILSSPDDDMIAQLMKSPVEEEIDSSVAFRVGVGPGKGTPTPP